VGAEAAPAPPPKVTHLKQLPDAIEESIFVEERFPVILDPTEQAGRFLKYQVRRGKEENKEEKKEDIMDITDFHWPSLPPLIPPLSSTPNFLTAGGHLRPSRH